MPKKKQPSITDTTLDDIVSSIPTGHEHEHEHEHEHDGAIELDEPVEKPPGRAAGRRPKLA